MAAKIITISRQFGSGGRSIGKALAEQLHKQFVDADEELVKTFGKSIPEIFADEGEAGFREKETAVLQELGKQSGLVIATGGGCVTQQRNYPLLHQNGILFWLQRDIQLLPTDGRPLSQSNRLSDLYRVRKPMYQQFADHTIDNNGSIEHALSQIRTAWEENL